MRPIVLLVCVLLVAGCGGLEEESKTPLLEVAESAGALVRTYTGTGYAPRSDYQMDFTLTLSTKDGKKMAAMLLGANGTGGSSNSLLNTVLNLQGKTTPSGRLRLTGTGTGVTYKGFTVPLKLKFAATRDDQTGGLSFLCHFSSGTGSNNGLNGFVGGLLQ